jgi:hypothetical protein
VVGDAGNQCRIDTTAHAHQHAVQSADSRRVGAARLLCTGLGPSFRRAADVVQDVFDRRIALADLLLVEVPGSQGVP